MSDPRQIPEQDRWRLYESAKQEWISSHPEATPQEYEQAMRRLADENGV